MSIPREAEGGTYIFLAQQWEPGGQPAYPGGAAIYPSSATPVEVRPHVDAEEFWGSFEPWPEEDADHSDGAQRGEFFFDLGDGRSLPLYPFIASMTCSRCAAVETYFIDDWDQRRNLARMKGFERGHTINESKLSDALAD